MTYKEIFKTKNKPPSNDVTNERRCLFVRCAKFKPIAFRRRKKQI